MPRRLEANLERMAELVSKASEELRGLAESAKSTDQAFEGAARSAGRGGGGGADLLGAVGGGFKGLLVGAAGAGLAQAGSVARQAFFRANRYGEDPFNAARDTIFRQYAAVTGRGQGQYEALSSAAQRTFAQYEEAGRYGRVDFRQVRKTLDIYEEQEKNLEQFRKQLQIEETARGLESPGKGIAEDIKAIREVVEKIPQFAAAGRLGEWFNGAFR